MLVQLICRSDKSPETKEVLEEPFEFDTAKDLGRTVILVPDLESYDFVRGQLFLNNMEAEVILIPPPAEYKPLAGKVPYAYVHDDYTAHCDPIELGKLVDGYHLGYYFKKKNIEV